MDAISLLSVAGAMPGKTGAGGASGAAQPQGLGFGAIFQNTLGQADAAEAEAARAATPGADLLALAAGRPLAKGVATSDGSLADDQDAPQTGDGDVPDGASFGALSWLLTGGTRDAGADTPDAADPTVRFGGFGTKGASTPEGPGDQSSARADAGDGDFEIEWRRLVAAAQRDAGQAASSLSKAQTLAAATAEMPGADGARIDADSHALRAGSDGLAAGRDGTLTQQIEASARAQAGQTPAQTRPGTPADQVVFQVQRALAGGTDRITIQLNPAELGRVDVRLDVGEDATIRAVVAVDRPETMELLQRDAKALMRALDDAGFVTDEDSLSFDLRQEQNGSGEDRAQGDSDNTDDDAEPAPTLSPAVTAQLVWSGADATGVNLMI